VEKIRLGYWIRGYVMAIKTHRLIVGSGRYPILEKEFLDFPTLRDWLRTNTLLTDKSIDLLTTRGEVSFGSGNDEEWFKYIPPPSEKL